LDSSINSKIVPEAVGKQLTKSRSYLSKIEVQSSTFVESVIPPFDERDFKPKTAGRLGFREQPSFSFVRSKSRQSESPVGNTLAFYGKSDISLSKSTLHAAST
jgi:hypothetical protein